MQPAGLAFDSGNYGPVGHPCALVGSIAFGLTGLEELYLYGSPKILDHDPIPIAGLPRLRILEMMNRRGYSPSVDELKRRIEGLA